MSNTLSVQLLFLFLTVFRPSAEHLNVNAITSDLPAGRVLGVAFSDDAKTVFIQQVPISAEKTGAADTSSLNLQLLSLSMDSHSVTAQGNLVGSSDSHGYPCGRIEAASKLQRLVTCGPGNHLDLFDSANLKTVGKIGSEQNETIQDFGLDRRRNIAFVLSLRKDSSLWLTSYSLLNGTQQHAGTGSGPARFARMSLAVEQEEGIVGLAVTRAGASGDTTEIFTCNQQPTPGRESIANVNPVTQLTLFR